MRLLLATTMCMLVSGCGRADAVAIDPADDAHCSVLAFYFHGFAQHKGLPPHQQRAAKGIHEWYAAKMREGAIERWGDMEGFEKEVSPLLEVVKSDPIAMRDEMLSCTERAVADPAFADFAKGLN